MALKKNIFQVVLLCIWLALGSSVLILLVAAISIKNHKSCKGIDIKISGVKQIFFLDKAEIRKIVSDNGIVQPLGMAITSFNLRRLEVTLEKNIWVKDAELFFDNNLILHINILEKEPVARVLAVNGSSFYIDSSGGIMPLNDKMNVKLPVFTGFPGGNRQSRGQDSLLLSQMKMLTMYILNDSFWLAQIAQIDITPGGNFELIPTIGDHIIEFGSGDNYKSKFSRLLLFYKQVLSHTGINTYSKISVKYDRQITGTKKGFVTRVDSVQALKSIQKMIDEAKLIPEDSFFSSGDKIRSSMLLADSMIMDIKIDTGNEVHKNSLKNNKMSDTGSVKKRQAVKMRPVQTISIKETAHNASQTGEGKPRPKAVMGKLDNEVIKK